ncbi:transposase [Xanthobacter sp. 91]|uniref:transposase n=1 Tax=Xanthobacter sp. 91 TaxID=1117244 RepID=UPI0009DCC747|nr:transposase [Xanthobacter sp. 91]
MERASDGANLSVLPFGPRRAAVDDRLVVSGIVYVINNGLQWKDAPKDYGLHKTREGPDARLDNR